ncbi:MAG: O-antigen ligase family protein [Burkholderiales bacterium]
MSLSFASSRPRPTIRPSSRSGRAWLVTAFAFLALLFGAIAGLFGGIPAVFLLVLILPLILTLRDYRVGVVALTILLPWATSPLLPHGGGLSVANISAAVCTLSFAIHVGLARRQMVPLPRIVVWCFIVPLSYGLALALPHLREAGVSIGGEDIGQYELARFVKGRYLDALIYVLYAYLLANAVRESKRPERWLIVLGISAVLPVAAVFGIIALYRVSLSELQAMRSFLAPLGYHANSIAWLLVSLIGPLLFVTAAVRGWARFAAAIVTAGVTMALLLTFSRGGFLALLAVLVVFAVQRKRVLALLAVVSVVAAGLLAVPAVQQRLLTGFESDALGRATSHSALKGDPLTAGRLAFWPLLAREVVRSPIWGRGLGSTAWSEPARKGIYTANHPHNLALAIAMDLGLLGFALMAYLFYRIAKCYARLAREPSLSASMRAFFGGALASMVGCLVMGQTTGGLYEPLPEQTFLWFSVGMAMCWWQLGQPQPAAGGVAKRPWAFGIRPMPQQSVAPGHLGMR